VSSLNLELRQEEGRVVVVVDDRGRRTRDRLVEELEA